ncbi:cell wall hydrolase [Sphingobium algorifonticola]|uniref:Cell wall hydrolase n=1 Tax=Sphingobium algorifonticola TaxID=2008318 RepID=A0A437JDM2_9SPHN|nr:cell wall hydrolase [Sphingobium algorifonticola]RVT43853.1 cell wall hydrolase [Sphingobium algorifonticola]
MSFRLKVATVTAFTLSAIAAVLASDASIAAGSNETLPVTIRPLQANHAPQAAGISFAAPREVVQPTDVPSTSNGEKVSDIAQPPASLADLVDSHPVPASLDENLRCLASAVYYEAKSESLTGQLAVARVIINRARSGRFADSLCGVVRQPSQFSFVRGGTIPQPSTASADWQDAVAIAQIALKDAWQTPAEGALYFHARRVSPGWGKPRLAAIDNHIFYR